MTFDLRWSPNLCLVELKVLISHYGCADFSHVAIDINLELLLVDQVAVRYVKLVSQVFNLAKLVFKVVKSDFKFVSLEHFCLPFASPLV